MDFILVLMLDPWGSVFQGLKSDTKASEFIPFSSELPSVPAIKISENGEASRSRAPLHELNVVVGLQVEAKLLVRSSNVFETSLSALENVEPPVKMNELKNTYFLNSFCLRYRSLMKGVRYGSS